MTSDTTTAGLLPTDQLDAAVQALVDEHGTTARERARRGVDQCARHWTEADGDGDAFRTFCLDHFAATEDQQAMLLDRLEIATEQIRGHLYEMRRNLRRWTDLVGEALPKTDALLATFDPAPDLVEQFYDQKLAFVALLNLERSTLDEMLGQGGSWDAARWAVRVGAATTLHPGAQPSLPTTADVDRLLDRPSAGSSSP